LHDGGALDLEAETTRRKKLRTGSATSASTVEELRCARVQTLPDTRTIKSKRGGDHSDVRIGTQPYQQDPRSKAKPRRNRGRKVLWCELWCAREKESLG
jgi:hypothetical protein